jgi:hypothetical protein
MNESAHRLVEVPYRLVIEKAQNGFLVYVNQDFSNTAIRPLPYVFETMENLLEFINKEFK